MDMGASQGPMQSTGGQRHMSSDMMDIDEDSAASARPVGAVAHTASGTGSQLQDSIWAVGKPAPPRNAAIPIVSPVKHFVNGLRSDGTPRWNLPQKYPAPSEEAARAREAAAAAAARQSALATSENTRPNAAARSFTPIGTVGGQTALMSPAHTSSNVNALGQSSNQMPRQASLGSQIQAPVFNTFVQGSTAAGGSASASRQVSSGYTAGPALYGNIVKPGEKTLKASKWA
jgi:hypothetical protein